MNEPLGGVRVVDLTSLLPGAVATGLLADLGAEVIKVERPGGGDGLRGVSAAHEWLNRGKRSIVIDLKDSAGRAAFLTLLAVSDVLIDSLRPGAMDRLDLGDDVVRGANPSLAHVSITFRGYRSAHAHEAGHDINAQAVAGLLSLGGGPAGRPGEQPLAPALQAADHLVGHQAVIAVQAMLMGRLGTGIGGRCDVSMVDAAYSLLGLAGATTSDAEPAAAVGLLTGGLACYRTYGCAGGGRVAVGALEPDIFGRLIHALELSPTLVGRQFDPASQSELQGRLGEAFGQRTREEWADALAGVDCCVTPVLDVVEALAAVEAPLTMVDGQGRRPLPIPQVPGVDVQEVARRSAPCLGADSDALFAWLEQSGPPTGEWSAIPRGEA